MPRMQNRYKKRVVGQYKSFTSAPAPMPIDILDLIVHGSADNDAEGDQQSEGSDRGKDCTQDHCDLTPHSYLLGAVVCRRR